MSLQTIIDIGHKIRNELSKEESLQYHRFVKRAPEYSAKQPYIYYQIDVKDSYKIDFSSLKEITDESIIKSKYYYLKYKTGEADTLVKYIYGDIAYPDYFKPDDPTNGAPAFKLNSFLRGNDEAIKIQNETLIAFRQSIENSLDSLLKLFSDKKYCYIHFNFNGKNWYETDLFDIIERSMVNNFTNVENDKLSLFEFITRTIAGKETFERMINFNVKNNYKNKCFGSVDEVRDLFYGLDFQQKYKIKNSKGDIVINVLPKGRINAKGVIYYFEKKSNYDYKNQKPEDLDPFAEPFINPEIEGIEKYDIIFSKPIKYAKPIGADLLEITDISQNLLHRVNIKIEKAKMEIPYRFTLDYAILQLLDEKKHTNHLLKILPLIYKDNYYSDDVLLPALIEKTEYTIRNGDGKKNYFGGLKQHFYFLTKLQINDTIMEIKKTKSYLLGKMLGKMAEPFAGWKKDCPIKSFEKSYVGNISRRIAKLDDVIEFVNYLNEKLTLHPPKYGIIDIKKSYLELINAIDEFSGNEKYNRHFCALGFFESYYKSVAIEEEQSTEEENINN